MVSVKKIGIGAGLLRLLCLLPAQPPQVIRTLKMFQGHPLESLFQSRR
jgi:hypothetical protein